MSASYPVHPWRIEETAFDAAMVKKNESVFALGNGYLGLRGCYEEGLKDAALGVRGTYLNGFYESEKIRYGEIAHAYAQESQTMLNVTDARSIQVSVDGETFSMDASCIHDFRRTLDLQTGVLTRHLVWHTQSGRDLHLAFTTLVSLEQQHAAAIQLTVTALDAPVCVQVASMIDGNVSNLTCKNDPRVGSGLQGRSLSQPVFTPLKNGCVCTQQTQHTHLCVACAVMHTAPTCARGANDDWRHIDNWQLTLQAGEAATITKYLVYEWGGAEDCAKLAAQAAAGVQAVCDMGFDALMDAQRAAMDAYWNAAGIELEGDDALLQGLRFNLFHLLQSCGHDGRTNISAKGLTGEGYEGHYFWDTETYVLPMFLFLQPEKAKGLLMYRYGILDNARRRAREMGHPTGALYPWRTIGGDECSAYYPAGTAQYHINADIAFAIKRYVLATGDMDFVCDYGAEMLAETARLWLNLGFYSEQKGGKFCINCVTGPDEYNVLVNNNLYTNLMAAQNMSFAAEMLNWMRANAPEKLSALARKIGLQAGEEEAWQKAANSIYVPYDEKTGLYLQDDGFLERTPWDVEKLPMRKPLLLHYHPLVIYRHMVCKQADLVLALYMLRDRFTLAEKERCFHFYDRVTTHDSSLSMATFSIIASEIGEAEKAYRYFSSTARMDLDDMHNNTKDGLHMANMAGTWMGITGGFAGMDLSEKGLSFKPTIPTAWQRYAFSVKYRGSVIHVNVTHDDAQFSLVSGEPVDILINGQTLHLQ